MHNSFTSRILNQKYLTDSITKFLPTGYDVETVVLLSDKKVDGHIKIDVDVEKLDNTGGRATYAEIKDEYGYYLKNFGKQFQR